MKFRLSSAPLLLALLGLASLCAAEPAATPSIAAKIDTGRLVDIHAPGDPLRWSIHLTNTTDRALSGVRLSWSVASWSAADRPATGSRSVADIAAGASTTIHLEHAPAALGWHELALELRDTDDALLLREVRRFSVGEAVKSTGEHFRYGICSHMLRHRGTPLFDTELALARHLGIDIIRTELAGWESTEPDEGSFDFSKPDLMLAALEPLGIEIQPIFAYSTQWGSTGDRAAKDWNEWNKTAPRLAPWLNYVGRVVDRYGDRVRYWEIWNEPDISFWRATTAQYTELFDATSALIKKKSPGARVLNGGLAMVKRPPNPEFVADFLATASQDNWDVLAYHDYHSFPQFLARRAEVEAHLPALRKPMPIWINEGGSHTLLAGGERTQALTLVKKISSAPAFGLGAYFWYNLRDDGHDPKDPEHHFGLTLYEGQPKPAWSAYQTLIRELGAARYLRSLPAKEIPSGAWAHLYARPAASAEAAADTHVLVLWQEGAARQIPNWLGVGPDARVTRVTDLMGNPVEAALADHGAVLKLTEEPVYVHIAARAGSEPALALKPLLETPALLVLIPGKPTSLSLRLNNPLDRPVTMRLALSGDIPGLRVSEPASEHAVKADGRIDFSTTLSLPAASPNSAATVPASPRLTLDLAIPETGLSLSARIPVSLATPIRHQPAGESGVPSLPETVPALVLDRRDDIHNLYSAEPLPAMQWRGPADLSAVARLAYDDSGLRLVVEARDDTHHQTELKENLWAADSLQLGLRFDETKNDYIEIGLARANDGKTGGWVFATSPDIPLARGRLGAPIRFHVARDDATATTAYHLYLPWSELGQSGPPAGGFRLNFIVNDDDGLGRKQWVKLDAGLGDEKNPAVWRVFSCQ